MSLFHYQNHFMYLVIRRVSPLSQSDLKYIWYEPIISRFIHYSKNVGYSIPKLVQ